MISLFSQAHVDANPKRGCHGNAAVLDSVAGGGEGLTPAHLHGSEK